MKFIVNVQHDCYAAGCGATGTRQEVQERQPSGRSSQVIVHKDDGQYIINTHAFHNARLLRRHLPRELTAPEPLYADRKARHTEVASILRVNRSAKREQARTKRAEKRTQKQGGGDQSGDNPAGQVTEALADVEEDVESEAEDQPVE